MNHNLALSMPRLNFQFHYPGISNSYRQPLLLSDIRRDLGLWMRFSPRRNEIPRWLLSFVSLLDGYRFSQWIFSFFRLIPIRHHAPMQNSFSEFLECLMWLTIFYLSIGKCSGGDNSLGGRVGKREKKGRKRPSTLIQVYFSC